MKFRIDRDTLAEAVAWTARSLPTRPPVPVLAGLLLDAADGVVAISGFDYEVSTRVELDAHVETDGRALVSGRLLAEIARALPPHPVVVAVDGARVTISCGNARFALPSMPVEDYPTLPAMPDVVGAIPAGLFAEAVGQVAIAAGRDDTIPMLTGVRLEISGAQLTLVATDRYRLAERHIRWSPRDADAGSAGSSNASSTSPDVALLIPARTLIDAAKSLAGSGGATDVTVALTTGGSAGEGMIGFASGRRQMTTRLLDSQYLPYQSLWPAETPITIEVATGPFIDAAKRVALLADRGTPVRLEFGDNSVTLSAGGGDDGRAEEQVEAAYDGEPFTTGFNAGYLLDGVGAIDARLLRIAFTTPGKPAVLSSADRVPLAGDSEGGDAAEDDPASDRSATAPGTADAAAGRSEGGVPEYRYLTMPMRLPG